MPKDRPAKSGYARLAQQEEVEDVFDQEQIYDDPLTGIPSLSANGSSYAPIQPGRRADRMSGSGRASPSRRRSSFTGRRSRANSGVDIKAINARLEKWAEEIADKFKIKRKRRDSEEEQPEIQYSVFQAPDWIRPATASQLADPSFAVSKNAVPRMTKEEFDDVVESVRVAIEMGIHPKLIAQGSSGSYFARTADGKTVGVFKPKDEEPYASKNPKWTKWIHRNLFPCFFGRACLIPNLSYVSEAAAYVLDCQLRTNIVPYTDVVSFSSKSFHYDYWDRRAFYRKKKAFPEKPGSLQVFLKGYKDATQFLKEHPWPDQTNRHLDAPIRRRRRKGWIDDCRPRGAPSDDEYETDSEDTAVDNLDRRGAFWTDALQQSLREQLERLVILDYIMRNTDRGLDNWMIRIDEKEQKASIIAEPPKDLSVMDNDMEELPPRPMSFIREEEPYKRQEEMMATSRSNTPSQSDGRRIARLGAIDNSLSWPWKHPDAWRSFPFGWLFLPVSLIGQPFSQATKDHFLPLLTSKAWWTDTQAQLRKCFALDSDFQERMYDKQIAVMKGQAWNVVETLKTRDHGPLELTRRARVCVWDDVVDVPVAVPLRSTAGEGRERASRDEVRTSSQFDLSRQKADDVSPQADTGLAGGAGLQSSGPLTADNAQSIANARSAGHRRGASDLPTTSTTKSAYNNFPSRPIPNSRVSFDVYRPQPHRTPSYSTNEHPPHRTRRHSLVTSRSRHLNSQGGGLISAFDEMLNDGEGDDEDGDLGYAALEDGEARKKKVIVERLEAVKTTPVFTWC